MYLITTFRTCAFETQSKFTDQVLKKTRVTEIHSYHVEDFAELYFIAAWELQRNGNQRHRE